MEEIMYLRITVKAAPTRTKYCNRMKARDQKFMDYWEKTRGKGRRKFVLKSGLLWGVLTALFTELFSLREKGIMEAVFSLEFVFRLGIFLIFGILLFGFLAWKLNERKYFTLKETEKDIGKIQ